MDPQATGTPRPDETRGAHGPVDDAAVLASLLDAKHVENGGATAVHHLGPTTLRKASVGPMDNNAYVLTAPDGSRLLVDAAADAPRLRALLAEAGEGDLVGIVTTHRHHDHVGALAEIAGETGAPTYAGAADADALPVGVDHRLDQGDTIAVGDLTVEVVALRGHTPGSIALVVREDGRAPQPGRAHLLTGDSLFPGGPGKTDSPADFASLMDDLEERVFGEFSDDTRVYPGHGDDTLVGIERPQLAQWRERGW